jgi:hypothetical protein
MEKAIMTSAPRNLSLSPANMLSLHIAFDRWHNIYKNVQIVSAGESCATQAYDRFILRSTADAFFLFAGSSPGHGSKERYIEGRGRYN